MASSRQASATIFLVMRKMRAPLIVLIVIFAITTVGLTLIPGQDDAGRPWRMGFFDAFYVMSYTASTIGFGEIPYPFTYNQRMWVTISIYLTVVGWAYAIGSLLALVQERSFRQALALQHFTPQGRADARAVPAHRRLRAHRRAARPARWTRWAAGSSSSTATATGSTTSTSTPTTPTCPASSPTRAIPGTSRSRGSTTRRCEGVLALTEDDEANLAVAQTVALLRPELPVITRAVSTATAERMRAFGTPTVVNPFDRFGDHLRIALRAPASYQLMIWLESGPGAPLPPRGAPPSHGHWVMCGYGRFGREVAFDLRAEGLHVTVVEPGLCRSSGAEHDPDADRRARRRAGGARAGRDRPRRRLRRRHRQRHDEPLAGRGRPPGQPEDLRRGPAEQGGERAAVRRRARRLAAGARGRRRARGLRPAGHAAAVAVPAGGPAARRRLGGRRGRAADVAVRRAPAGGVEGAAHRRRGALRAGVARGGRRAAWATCCATPTTATSACTPSRCCSPAGTAARTSSPPTTTSRSPPTTSCCWSAGPRRGGCSTRR